MWRKYYQKHLPFIISNLCLFYFVGFILKFILSKLTYLKLLILIKELYKKINKWYKNKWNVILL